MAKNNTFDFGNFFQSAVEREYRPHESVKEGEGVMLWLNLGFLTVERMEQIEAEYEKIFTDFADETAKILEPVKEAAAKIEGEKTPESVAKAQKEVEKALEKSLPKVSLYHVEKAILRYKARQLGGDEGDENPENRLINKWNVVAGGKPVPVSFETFIKMPKPQLDHLYDFVLGEASNPTKKNEKLSNTI